MSAVICSRVFITMGRTVGPAAAKAGSFSIWAIWTRQAWQPAPSLKYSSTFLPRRPAKLACVPEVSVRVKSGATRITDEDCWREVSIIATTIAITATVAPTDANRIRRRRRCSCCTFAARNALMCSRFVSCVPCRLVPVVIGGSSLVGRGWFRAVFVAGRGILQFRVVRQGRALPPAGAVPERGVDKHAGQRQDDQAQGRFRDRRGDLLHPAEDRSQTSN